MKDATFCRHPLTSSTCACKKKTMNGRMFSCKCILLKLGPPNGFRKQGHPQGIASRVAQKVAWLPWKNMLQTGVNFELHHHTWHRAEFGEEGTTVKKPAKSVATGDSSKQTGRSAAERITCPPQPCMLKKQHGLFKTEKKKYEKSFTCASKCSAGESLCLDRCGKCKKLHGHPVDWVGVLLIRSSQLFRAQLGRLRQH